MTRRKRKPQPDPDSIRYFFGNAPIILRMFEVLAETPHGLTRPDLLARIYNGHGEPECKSALSARIAQFNREAGRRGLGCRIRCTAESGRRYRIFVVRS